MSNNPNCQIILRENLFGKIQRGKRVYIWQDCRSRKINVSACRQKERSIQTEPNTPVRDVCSHDPEMCVTICYRRGVVLNRVTSLTSPCSRTLYLRSNKYHNAVSMRPFAEDHLPRQQGRRKEPPVLLSTPFTSIDPSTCPSITSQGSAPRQQGRGKEPPVLPSLHQAMTIMLSTCPKAC